MNEKQAFPRRNGGGKLPAAGLHVVLISLYHFGAFGARVLADLLKARGHRVSLVFFKRDKTNEMALPTRREMALLGELLKELAPGLVGISTRSTFFPVARDITAAVRPDLGVPVIWGGTHAIVCPEECIRYADIVCSGEGEEPLVMLADALLKNEDYSRIPGLLVRAPDGTVTDNGSYFFDKDLDSLPLPGFGDPASSYVIEDDRCDNREPYYNESLVHYNFMTGRGCPFHCDFCSNSVLSKVSGGKFRRLRQRSVDNVIRELALAKKTFRNLLSVSSNDELFGLDPVWLREFCSRYREEIGLAFHCDIHPLYVTEEKISMLAGMGLKTISMGLQSGNERIRREVLGRNTPGPMLEKAAALFRKYGIFPSYDLIFDNPLETAGEVRETLHFMMRLPRPFRMNMYSLQYHPKTALTRRLLEAGLIREEDVDGVSLKGFSQWHMRPDLKTGGAEMVFLYRLFLMLGAFIQFSRKYPERVMPVFPVWFILLLDRLPLLRACPALTAWADYLPKATFAAGLLLRLEFSGFFSRLARAFRRSAGGSPAD
jgi:radical SAM superfamily enzyme YgiQ (UPF0313 family)